MTQPAPSPRFRDIRLCVPVRASPERVYGALTSARELCAWWLDRAETHARNLGKLRMVWPSSGNGSCLRECRGVFVDLEPARKVAWLWGEGSRRPGVPPLNTFFIESRRGGCDVTLVHAGFKDTPYGAKRVAAWQERWEDCLSKLSLYLESGRICKHDRISLTELALLRRKSSSRRSR